MIKKLQIKRLLIALVLIAGNSLFGQVQLNQLSNFGTAIMDINSQGHGIHMGGYYDFSTNTSTTLESGVYGTSAINDNEDIIGLVDDGSGNMVPGIRIGGVWTAFPSSVPLDSEDTLYDISENGVWVVGQTGWDAGTNTAWGFIYNRQTEEFRLLESPLYEYSAAYGVNNDGIAVGWVDDLPSGMVRIPAVFMPDGSIIELTDFSVQGSASGINNLGQVAGDFNGQPFIYDIDSAQMQSFDVSSFIASGSFVSISDTGVAIGYGQTFTFSRLPIVYHPLLGTQPKLLTEVLTDFGVDASSLDGTAYRISSDGNYVCGFTDGPAFMAMGWAVYFDDSLLDPCAPSGVPYLEDFNSVTPPDIPECTSIENAGSGNNWETTDAVDGEFDTIHLRYKWHSSNPANAWFYTRGINLVGGVEYEISYDYGSASSGVFPEKMKVAYGTDPNHDAMTTILADYPSITTGNSAVHDAITFTPASSGTYYFGFNAYSDPDEFYLFLDNIKVILAGDDGPGCDWTVHVWGDNFGDEITWNLKKADGTTVLSGGNYGSGFDDTKTATANGPLTFYAETMGNFGDNELNYEVSNGTEIVAQGHLDGNEQTTHGDLTCDGPGPEPGDDCSIEYAYSNENGTGNTQTLLFADDFAIAPDTAMTINTVHFTIINNITDFSTIAFYEDNGGQPAATPVQSFSNITPDSQTIVDNNFGLNFYDVMVTLPTTVELSTGTYWVALQNTIGTDGGTNYWAITNSGFGQPGKYSTDGGVSWTANSSAFNFAFTLEGTCETNPGPEPTCEQDFYTTEDPISGAGFSGGNWVANDVIVAGSTQFKMQTMTFEAVAIGGEPTSFDFEIFKDNGTGGVGDTTGMTYHFDSSNMSFVPNGLLFGAYPQFTVTFDLPDIVLQANGTADTRYWLAVTSDYSTTGDFTYWVSYLHAATPDPDSNPTWQYLASDGIWAQYDSSGPNEGYMKVEGECETLGVSDLTSFDFAYYPNPVRDVLNIKSQKAVKSVEAFNMAGQKVLNATKVQNGQIDVNTLTPGVYVFKVILDGGQVETFKIIKK